MKRYFTLLFLICLFYQIDVRAQWERNLLGTLFDGVSVTSSGGSVAGTNAYEGWLVSTTSDVITVAENGGINAAFDNVSLPNQFKAVAGKPLTITLKFTIGEERNAPANNRIKNANGTTGPLGGAIGKNEQDYAYDEYISIPLISESWQGFEGIWLGQRTMTFQGTYTFPVGRTRGWLVFSFLREFSSGLRLPFTMVLPFVVEGPTAPIQPLGVTTQPQIPYLVIHNPPGDGSTTTISNIGTTCRSFEEKVSKDESDQTYGDFKAGFKGSIGFLYELELEAYVQLSVERTEGVIESRQNDDESCITISRSLTTQSSGRGAQNNDLFIGYGIDLEYGRSRRVSIINNQVRVDTGMVYSPIDSTKTDFFLTKIGIEDDIVRQQAIVNDSLNKTIAERAAAQYQINVWRQVLDKNAATIASAASQAGSFEDFSGESPIITKERSYSFSRSHSIEVEHYIENQAGLEGAVFFAGSGFKIGSKFKTTKSFGEVQTTTGQNIESVKVQLYDNDVADRFRYKIVNDPVYGTPIFLLDSINSFTSCPYEGGIKLDQPLLKLSGSTSRSVSVSNVSLGTAGRFNVEVCNNTPVVRNYGLGYVNESAKNNLILRSNSTDGTVSPINGVTQFATIFNVPAGKCKTGTFEISMERGDAAAPMAYQGIEFVLYSECDTNSSIASRIFANIDFAGPPPPTGVAASASEICTGTPVTITANCPVTTLPRWYTTAEGGFPISEGASVVVNPTTNTTYYVGCETPDYKRDRVATQLVLVGSPSTVLNLTTDYSTNSLQIANTTLTATNKINDPARVTYKAGNSLTFNPGFEVKAGSNFLAEIGGCANIPINGLVAYYPFNGNANDESGNGHNGIIDGATPTADKFGASGKALNFAGDDVVRIPNLYNATTQPLNNVTYSLWFKPNQNYGAADFFSLIIRSTDAGFTEMIGKGDFLGGAHNEFQFYMWNGNFVFNKATTTTFVANQWYHVVGTRDNTTTKVYINAAKEGEVTYTNPPVFYPDLYLGGHKTSNRWYFNGVMDDLRIYNRALTDAEVTAIYNAEKL